MASSSRELLKSWKLLRTPAKYVKADQLRILYFRKGLLAVEKPYGLAVHNGPGVKLCLTDLLPYFQQKLRLDSVPELVNRLDKDCYGIQLLSCNTSMARQMENLYERRRITKEYLAVTTGVPSVMAGEINIPIGQGVVGQREKMVLREDLTHFQDADCPPDIKFPRTSFTVLDSNRDTCALVKFTSNTGYKHQVRVHASDGLGCPILGDHKYSESIGPQIMPLRLMQLLGMAGVKSANRTKGIIRPWQRALVPLHLLASCVTIPEIDNHPIQIQLKAPLYFKRTLADLSLHPKRANIIEGQLKYNRHSDRSQGRSGDIDSLFKLT